MYKAEKSRVSQSNEDVGCAVLGLLASPAFTPSQQGQKKAPNNFMKSYL